jgi:fructan beta-fructosidase
MSNLPMMLNRREFSRLAALAAAAPLHSQALHAQLQSADTYTEKYRPQFHFTPRTGWTNDPNGLVYYKGEYHLFFQHNPFDVVWGNMTWGHAVSTDLVHWKQIENAILPDKLGTIYSGSAVVDVDNTAGFQSGSEKTIVCIYTAAGGTSPESKGVPFSQCIAYSKDRGRTFTKYSGNPVVPNIVGSDRDPKVVWHAPTKKWIMALFLDGNTYGLLSSPDLKHWTQLHHLTTPGVAECPDFFQMPVENEPGVSKWVFTGANATYIVGTFDGTRFSPEVLEQPLNFGANYYAVQTYSNLPNHRRVQIAWMNGGKYPAMPFNQQMSCPVELKLYKSGFGSYKLNALPVQEIESLRGKPFSWSNLSLAPLSNPLASLSGDLWDISAEIELGTAKEITFKIRGRNISYTIAADPNHNRLTSGDLSANLPPKDGRIQLRILVDRTSVEIFANHGDLMMPATFLPDDNDHSLALTATAGSARVTSLTIHPMHSAWRPA